jgi:hypothetical protein
VELKAGFGRGLPKGLYRVGGLTRTSVELVKPDGQSAWAQLARLSGRQDWEVTQRAPAATETQVVQPETFTPTHEAADGTPLQATDEPGIYIDAEGMEVEDDSATPIQEAQVPNEQGERPQAAPRAQTQTDDDIAQRGQAGPAEPATAGAAAAGDAGAVAGEVESGRVGVKKEKSDLDLLNDLLDKDPPKRVGDPVDPELQRERDDENRWLMAKEPSELDILNMLDRWEGRFDRMSGAMQAAAVEVLGLKQGGKDFAEVIEEYYQQQVVDRRGDTVAGEVEQGRVDAGRPTLDVGSVIEFTGIAGRGGVFKPGDVATVVSKSKSGSALQLSRPGAGVAWIRLDDLNRWDDTYRVVGSEQAGQDGAVKQKNPKQAMEPEGGRVAESVAQEAAAEPAPETAPAPEPEPRADATPSSPTATPPIGGVGASAGEQGRRLDRLPLEVEVEVDGERQVVRGMASEWLAQSDARLDRLQKLRNCAKG